MKFSQALYARAQKVIPGGVNSPVRSFNGVGGEPIFFKSGEGAYLYDVDQYKYIDYVGSWGPLILGHCHPKVMEAMIAAIHQGSSFGAPTELEILLAEKIIELMPNLEMVRMVNSGTEATMTAIRMARGITGRDKIIKFVGCYHGHSDSLLVKAGSGLLTLGIPSTPGVPESVVQHTLTASFNNLQQVAQLFEKYRGQIAGIIIEPVAGNMGCVLPTPEFLPGLRKICDAEQAILIFDEVMTGFRVAKGGAQQRYNVVPDITTLGKVIGGGMPVGAIAGSKAIMEHLAPKGPIYQAGTLSGNPCAMAAGIATLQELSAPNFYQDLIGMTEKLVLGIKEVANAHHVAVNIAQAGSMFGICFTQESKVVDYNIVANSDIQRFNQFFHGLLAKGIYLAPSAFEAGFMSSAHKDQEIALTLNAMDEVFSKF